ncbi:MAG TPA: branched-chain amino acid ABC transporter permease [Polyangiaceae bacterium]|nr:branched-chain amino acid ABC transporter permease [Polyangiaceae bacterium]
MMSGKALENVPADAHVEVALPHGRWHQREIAFWLAPIALYFVLPGYLVLGSQIFITALFALSLDLVLGYAGILSLGHAAFFGVGAYTAGLCAVHGWSEPLTGLLFAGLLAAALGFSVSWLVVRGEDLARLMLTLGIGLVLYEAANKAAAVTGGVDGLSGVSMGKVLGVFEFGFDGKTAYVYSFVVLFLLFCVTRRLVHSPFGLALRGLREGARRLPALGVSARSLQVRVFTLGAGVAGVAGALLTQTTQFVGLEVLGFQRSAELLIMLVLGGAGRLYGALVGSAVFMVAQAFLSGLSPVYWQFWIGLLLLVIVLLARGGLLGAIDQLRARFTRRSA